jgi:hypothetical protein
MVKKLISYFMFSFVFTAFAVASDVSVTAEISSRQISLGGRGQYTISVNGTQKASPVDVKAEGLDIRYLGPSRRISIVNGVTESSIAFTYSLFPLQTGEFEIPSVAIEADGETFYTEPIKVQVVDAGAAGSTAQSPASAVQSLEDKIFIGVEVPQKTFYKQEPVPVNIVLYVSGVQVRDIQMPQIAKNGDFDIGEYAQPQQTERIVQGMRFDVLEFKTVLYPLKTGALTLGPVTIGANIISQVQGGNDLDNFNRFFGDDFFSGMFQRIERHPVTINSQPITLSVMEVPEKGRPADFSGAVGKFDLDVKVSPTEVKAGDPITVRMSLKGQGNLELANLPQLRETKLMKVYDPQVRQENGERIAEQVVIPQSENLSEIPAIKFSYFDSYAGEYRTVQKGPFPVRVKPPERGEDLKIVGPTGKQVNFPAATETLGEDIVFIKEDIGRIYPMGYSILRSWQFYFLLSLIMGGWITLLLIWNLRYRLANDESFAGKMMAPRSARKGIVLARQLAAAGQKQEFYDVVFKTLQNYMNRKYNIAPGSFSLDTVRDCLPQLKPEIFEMLSSIFMECEIVRYAAATITNDQMHRTGQTLEKLIDQLERIG